MLWIKTLPCAATIIPMPWHQLAAECAGPIEADHMGARGIGRKASDGTCGPLCTKHHRARTDHTGIFRYANQAQLRVWRDGVLAWVRSCAEAQEVEIPA